MGVAPEQRDARHHHARRAESALESMLLPESFLNGMQLAALLQSFDGTDVAAVRLYGEDRARLHRIAVDDDGAGTAVRRVAADVRARQTEVIAQQVDQQIG